MIKSSINNLFGTARDLTVDHLKNLIKTKELDFETIRDAESIRHYFEEAVEDIEVATDKFNSKTGERIYKQATFPGSQKDLLNAIYKMFSEWYLNDYEDRFKVNPTYTKSPVDVLKDLKAAAWMIAAEDIPTFLNGLINTSQVINGAKPTKENQTAYWIISSIKGGGKTTLLNQLEDGFKSDGYKCERLSFPEKNWPDLRPFANNHLAFINDILDKPDYDVYKKLTRREDYDSVVRCVGKIHTSPRAVIWGNGNDFAPYESDRGTTVIHTVNCSVQDLHQSDFGRKILHNATLCNTKSYSILRILRFYAPVHLGKIKNESKSDENILRKSVKEIGGIEILIKLICDYKNGVRDDIRKAENFGKISINDMCKYSSLTISQKSLINKILIELKNTYGLVQNYKSQGKYEYTKWDLTKIKDINFDMLSSDELDTSNFIDEVKENQKVWDEIIDFYSNPDNYIDDPNPTKEEDVFDELSDEELDELFECFDEEETKDSLYKNDKTFDKIDEANIWQKSEVDKKPVNHIEDQPSEDTPYERLNPANTEKYIFPCDLLSDKGVKSMRNFIFECDEISIKEQVEMIKENKDVINRAVFSGSKSIHCRITIDKEPKDKDAYKFIWNYLNNKYFDGKADKACSNPSRLTRTPNAIRPDNKKNQKLLFSNNIVISLDESLNKDYNDFLKSKEMAKEMVSDVKSHKRESDDIVEELENFEDRTSNHDAWQLAYSLATNDGNLAYEDAAKAVSYIGCLGFTAEEIKEQIDFGSWNFTTDYIESLIND